MRRSPLDLIGTDPELSFRVSPDAADRSGWHHRGVNRPLATRRTALAAVGVAWASLTGALAVMAVYDGRLRAAGRDDLVELLTADGAVFIPAAVSALAVGSALVLRRRNHPVGWLLLALGSTIVPSGAATSYVNHVVLAQGKAPPGAALVAVLIDSLFVVWLALIVLILLLTPTGRPPQGRWHWVAPTVLASCGVALLTGVFTDYGLDPPYQEITSPWALAEASPALVAVRAIAVIAVHVCVVAAAVSMVRRFRSARGSERLQLRWLAMAAVPLPVLVVGAAAAAMAHQSTALAVLAGLFVAILPVATGLAIVQYQLYDVERILSRALSYVMLSGLVVVSYVGVVLSVVSVLGRVAGRSQAAAALATLVAVSVAWPARGRVQRLVDRRFNRRQFEAVRLVREYVTDPPPGSTIEHMMRGAVGDPSLDVAYWIEDRSQWVTEDGHAVAGDRPGIDVRRRDSVIARVTFDPARAEAPLVERVVAEARPELESAQLRAAVALQLVEVRESRARIVAAQLAERRMIERNLHDGVQQRLLGMAMQLRAAEMSGDPDRLREALHGAVDETQVAVVELRALANGLHPAVLSDGGLGAALDDLASRIPVAVHLDATRERFPPEVEATAWFIACEAVTNAVKHAHPSRVDIQASRHDGHLVVVVQDDGVGGADVSGGGLRGIADRAEAAGGRLAVETLAGAGTTVVAELPCGS